MAAVNDSLAQCTWCGEDLPPPRQRTNIHKLGFCSWKHQKQHLEEDYAWSDYTSDEQPKEDAPPPTQEDVPPVVVEEEEDELPVSPVPVKEQPRKRKREESANNDLKVKESVIPKPQKTVSKPKSSPTEVAPLEPEAEDEEPDEEEDEPAPPPPDCKHGDKRVMGNGTVICYNCGSVLN